MQHEKFRVSIFNGNTVFEVSGVKITRSRKMVSIIIYEILYFYSYLFDYKINFDNKSPIRDKNRIISASSLDLYTLLLRDLSTNKRSFIKQ